MKGGSRGHADSALGTALVVARRVGVFHRLVVVPNCILVVAPANQQIAQVDANARLKFFVLEFLRHLQTLEQIDVRLLARGTVFLAGQDPKTGQVVLHHRLGALVAGLLRLAKRLFQYFLRLIYLPLGLIRRRLAKQLGQVRLHLGRLAKRWRG